MNNNENVAMTSIENICKKSIEFIKYAREVAVKNVSNIQIITYYIIGMWIVEEQQNGKDRAGYGDSLLKELSKNLTNEFGNGYSESNLRNFRKFYLTFKGRLQKTMIDEFTAKNIATAVAEFKSAPFTLDWSHYLILMRIEDEKERNFYEIESKNSNWSKRELQRQYNSSLYERLALSKNKDGVIKMANKGNVIEKPSDIIKQPTVLEFLGLDEKEEYVESTLESAILDKLQKFLLEMGKGYLFEKRQKRFTFNEDNYYVDLVLYNRLLKCYVLVDLKTDKITHQDLGQMQMYVNYFDRYEKKDFENPTIGILLCKEKDGSCIFFM